MELLPYLEHYIYNEIVQWIPWVAARSPQCFCIHCNMAWLILERPITIQKMYIVHLFFGFFIMYKKIVGVKHIYIVQ